jgi:hypothetical protein
MQSATVYRTYKVHRTDVYTNIVYTELLLNMQEDSWKQIIYINSGSNFFKKKKNANDVYFTFRPRVTMSRSIQTWPNGTKELRSLLKAIRK